MKLTFIGATHEVTGSCYYLEACGKKILIDCGMEQGPDLYENKPIPVPAGDIDMVLLTKRCDAGFIQRVLNHAEDFLGQ